MALEITLDEIKRRKCLICGDTHKSMSDIFCGQMHVATVVTCCNCGFTMTFAHSASEYAKYLETHEFTHTNDICKDEDTCMNKLNCPKRLKGRKL